MDKKEELQERSFSRLVPMLSHTLRIFRIIWSVARFQFLTMIFLSILMGAAPTILILATQIVVNNVVLSWNEGFSQVIYALSVLGGVMIFNETCSILRVYVEKIFETALSYHVDILVMKKAAVLHLRDFENHEVQDQIKRVQNESKFRIYDVFKQVMAVFSGFITLLSSVSILFFWHWWAAVMILVVPVLFFPLFLRLGEKEFLYLWQRAPKMREAWYISYIMTRDFSFKEIKLYQLGAYLIRKYQEIHNRFISQDKEVAAQRRTLSFLYQIINYAVVLTIIYFILKAAYFKQILIGNMVSYLQAISLTLSTVQSLTQGLLLLCQHNLFLEQLFSYLDMKTESKQQMDLPRRKLQHPISHIEFRQIRFRYPQTDHYALDGISFQLKTGETLAIVGPNGSGKSTLIKILTQMYTDFEGEYRINGISVKEYDPDEINRRIGSVFQDFVKYEMPLRQNIGFGDLQKMNDDISLLTAAEKAGLHPLLQSLPDKMETQLGKLFQGGYQLSGGQWQRVAISRAYVRDADIYILDEPSSFLDPQAEHEVFRKFKDLVRNRIGIFISHRLSSARYADKIIVLDRGRIVEMGSHDELMKQNQLYAEMFTKQASSYVNHNFTSVPDRRVQIGRGTDGLLGNQPGSC